MINRISEIPFWGPEEQIRRFVNQHDDDVPSGETQQSITQKRIENLDDIFQKQLIWSYEHPESGDAYFWWDWCPVGSGGVDDPRWRIVEWYESQENLSRELDRTFSWKDFKGFTNRAGGDEMVEDYDAATDEHALSGSEDGFDLDSDTLRHNIMRSYLEVSEWLGDGALVYGSHNGFVSRKMSLAWLFCAIRALINWKMNNTDKYAEVDIEPLDAYDPSKVGVSGRESFLPSGVLSTQGVDYEDYEDLDQISGHCARQLKVRARKPNVNGTLTVRGNEWHYGERAYFWTHTSFVGECRFFHNARFLGQTTFDKEINGTAMRSRWSDLAEYREADAKYAPGTLVMFGGEKEITICDGKNCHAIVTTKPGLVLNSPLEEGAGGKTMVGLALVGKVPVKVVGDVKKFDRLVPSRKYKGQARKRHWFEFFKRPIGIALSDAKDGKVDCMTKMEF